MSKKEPVIESRPEQFKRIALELSEMYAKKNADYGNSFGDTFSDVGIISAYTRISDKFNRFKHAVTSGEKFNYESLGNTISDLGCYCIMTLIELQAERPVPTPKHTVMPQPDTDGCGIHDVLDGWRKAHPKFGDTAGFRPNPTYSTCACGGSCEDTAVHEEPVKVRVKIGAPALDAGKEVITAWQELLKDLDKLSKDKPFFRNTGNSLEEIFEKASKLERK